MLVSPLPFCLPFCFPLSAASLSSFSRPLPFPPPASSCCGLVLRPAAFSLSFFQIVAASWHWPPSVLAEHPQGLLGLQPFLTLRGVQARCPLAARCLSSARVVAVVYWSDWVFVDSNKKYPMVLIDFG